MSASRLLDGAAGPFSPSEYDVQYKLGRSPSGTGVVA